MVYAGNFVDLGIFDDQEWVNAQRWIFDGDTAVESVVRTVERAPDAEVVIVSGMPNWRSDDGLNERGLHRIEAMEAAVGRPVIASDTTLYWALFRSLGITSTFAPGTLLGPL